MSTLVTNTITGLSTAANITIGSTPVVSASANSLTIRGEGSAQTSVQQGLAKCWINQDDQTTINDSLNVGSLTDVGSGRGGVNFTNNMGDANFAPVVSGTNISSHSGVNAGTHERDAISTSKFNMRTGTASGGPHDMDKVTGIAHGDLA